MSSRGGRKVGIVPKVDPSKLEKIKAGIKTKTESGVKSNQNVTVNSRGDKIIAVQKEKKVEESGVTRKKRNFVMYESKTGTEKETDLQKIKGQKLRAPKPRVVETVILKRKQKEYLDNFQYHETKVLKKKKPAVVIHERLSAPVGGSYEEVTYQKSTLRSTGSGKNSRPGSAGSRTTTTRTNVRQNRNTNVRSSPPKNSATNARTETTRIGRRTGPNAGQTKTVTKTTTRTTTTNKGGDRKTQTQTRTTTTRGRK